jgi:acyl-CoA synthetase (AMP-forming)/AMP-acid ligase II
VNNGRWVMTIARLLVRSAQQWAEQPALIDPVRRRSITFSELAEAALFLGRTLRRRGLNSSDRVAILADATPEYLVADYGIMSAGLVRVPLDPSLSANELANQIYDAEARLLLFDTATAERAALVLEQAEAVSVDRLVLDLDVFDHPREDNIGNFLNDEDIGPSALASLNYTGGTSGEPKAVMLGHDNLRAAVQNIIMARGMGSRDVMVNMRPLWPIAAIVVLAHLAAGGTVVLGRRFEAARMIALLDEYRAAATSLVPTHLVRVLRDCPPSALRSLDALRSIEIGAAAVPLEMFEQALGLFGSKIGVLYGLTEAPWSCYLPPSALDAPPDVRRARMKSVGWPVFGCDVMIASEAGPAMAEQSGEVLVHGAHVMKGYWKRPGLTAQVVKDGWFRTGDLGSVGNDGTISVTGRIKEVIRTGGKSVQPNEVEAALCRHPSVAEASVVGLADAEWGELVTAVVVPTPGAEINELALKEHCAALLSPHKRPKLIQIVRELPKSHYGKIQRSKVRLAAAERYRGGE